MNISEIEYIQNVRRERWENLEWSSSELPFKTREKYRNPILVQNEVPVSIVLKHKLRNSCFGRFLKVFNTKETQTKLLNDNKFGIELWDKALHSEYDKKNWECANNFTDDALFMLETAIKEREILDIDYLYQNLKALRLMNCQINALDKVLKRYKNLKILVLSGNFLENCPGRNLPKSLRFLELFGNKINDLTSICTKCKCQIYHLGIGRNFLTDGSKLHLLSASQTFEQLHSLDLSENDICDLLSTVLLPLATLQELRVLALEGNPCATCYTYKDIVCAYLPKLLYLDGTEILPTDFPEINESFVVNGTNSGALTFTCYRLMGLPPPPKEKNVIHNFYLEVNLPLLEDVAMPQLEVEEEEIVEVKIDNKKKKDKVKDSKSESRSAKEDKVDKKAGPYGALNEDDGKPDLSTTFKTERKPYSKIIKFEDPSFVAETPDNNLIVLRDTLRSCVTVKIIYLKTMKPKKQKKKPKPKKGETNVEEIKPPEEIVAKKITLGTFKCNLSGVNWSDSYADFYWADVPETVDGAIPIEGSLEALTYIEKGAGAKKDNEKKKKDKKGEAGDEVDPKDIFAKLPVPTVLTCQVGFGLKRGI